MKKTRYQKSHASVPLSLAIKKKLRIKAKSQIVNKEMANSKHSRNTYGRFTKFAFAQIKNQKDQQIAKSQKVMLHLQQKDKQTRCKCTQAVANCLLSYRQKRRKLGSRGGPGPTSLPPLSILSLPLPPTSCNTSTQLMIRESVLRVSRFGPSLSRIKDVIYCKVPTYW